MSPVSLSNDLYRLQGQHCRAVADTSIPVRCLEKLSSFPELPFRIEAGRTIKVDDTTWLVQSVLPTDRGRMAVACKRVRRTHWKRWISALLRGNRAYQSWNLARRLTSLGIGTARPVAAIVPSRIRPWRDTFVMTEWLDGAMQVDHFVAALRELPDEQQFELESKAAVELGRLIGRMHALGLSHRDLKVANLMLLRSAESVAAFVIDLDGASIPWLLTKRRRLKDLSRLAICFPDHAQVRRTTLLRFVRAYLSAFANKADVGGRRVCSREIRRLWTDLAKAAAELRHRKARRAGYRGDNASADDSSSCG